MASWSSSGYCYCEYNAEGDTICDSYLSYDGYTTYAMSRADTSHYHSEQITAQVIGYGDCNEYSEISTSAANG